MKPIELYELIKSVPVPDDKEMPVIDRRSQWIGNVLDAISAEVNIDTSMLSCNPASVLRLSHIKNIGEYIRRGEGWANCFKNFRNIPLDDRRSEFPIAFITSRLVAAGLLSYINAKERLHSLKSDFNVYNSQPGHWRAFIEKNFSELVSLGSRISGNHQKFIGYENIPRLMGISRVYKHDNVLNINFFTSQNYNGNPLHLKQKLATISRTISDQLRAALKFINPDLHIDITQGATFPVINIKLIKITFGEGPVYAGAPYPTPLHYQTKNIDDEIRRLNSTLSDKKANVIRLKDEISHIDEEIIQISEKIEILEKAKAILG